MEPKFYRFKTQILPRTINDKKERERAIKENRPARFEIKEDRELDTRSKLWDGIRTFDSRGKKAINEHHDSILKHAQKHNVDPDLIRSVMFAEQARGHKIILDDVLDSVQKSSTALPMNVNKRMWSPLIDKKPEDLYDPDHNIEAGTVLLRRIADRIDKSDPVKIGTLWQGLGLKKTNEFGTYIGQVYKEKPWQKID